MRRAIALGLAAVAAGPAWATDATTALGSQWNTICLTASGSTLLYVRCGETLSSTDANANYIAAEGQRLEEIPGQVRIATRDLGNLPGAHHVALGNGATATVVQSPWGALSLDAESEAPLGAGWSWFASADIGWVDRDAGANEAGFDADTWALTLGADWRPRPDWTIGAAINHVSERLDYSASGSTVDTDFTGLLLLASHGFNENWSLDGYAGWVDGGYDLHREIEYTLNFPGGPLTITGVATAAPDAERRFAGGSVTRYWSRAGWDMDLALGYDWTRTEIDPYVEDGGAGVGLTVPGREVETRRAHLDFGLARSQSMEWGVWQPSLRIGWRQEIAGRRRQVTVTLTQDPLQYPITFDTEDADTGWAELSLGSVFVFTGGHSAFIHYQQRFGHDFLQERILALGWRMEL
jgi:hypothetical protein